jgi:Icc-related predicted phosphoesterase
MKCLFVSDLHYALKQYDWISAVAENFDVIVVGGDHLDISGHVDGRAQIVVIMKYLRQLQTKTQLFVCSGNHDLDRQNAAGEKVAGWMKKVRRLGIQADGDSPTFRDTLFTICPWWDGPSTRREVYQQLARDASQQSKKWIWIYHSPPEGSPISTERGRNFGDEDLTNWIQEFNPTMVLCGHIHQAPFHNDGSWADQIGSTWVFNSGRQIGPIPTHIVIDTEQQQALWFSIAGNEFVDLSMPLERPIHELRDFPDWLKA